MLNYLWIIHPLDLLFLPFFPLILKLKFSLPVVKKKLTTKTNSGTQDVHKIKDRVIPDCFDHNVDIHGDFIVPWDQGGSVANVKHPLACQKLCRAKDGCNFFVYGMSNHPVVLNRRRCFFKAWKTGAAAHAKIVSGPKLCWAADCEFHSHCFMAKV